jgi:pilus assembly protein CpaF
VTVTSATFRAAVERSIRAGLPPDEATITAIAVEHGPTLGEVGRARAVADLSTRLVGLGPLAAVAADPAVTDVLVNGDGSVWVDRGDGVDATSLHVPVEELRALAVRLAGAAGRRLDDAQPWVDGVLPGGIRLHAVLPPLAESGAHLSLRVARPRLGGLDALEGLGALVAGTGEVLRRLVHCRASVLVTGGTGAGKTTVLGALLSECPHNERLVVVEDVRELAPDHPHVVRLQGRDANVEGAGAVPLTALVRQALRMRPDRLVVGEVRGAEVRDLLAALNTGHEGGASTLHANGPEEVPARLEALGALAGMDRAAVHSQLRGAVQAVVHVARAADGRRRVERVGVVVAGDPEEPVRVLTALDASSGRLVDGPGNARLHALLAGAGSGRSEPTQRLGREGRS